MFQFQWLTRDEEVWLREEAAVLSNLWGKLESVQSLLLTIVERGVAPPAMREHPEGAAGERSGPFNVWDAGDAWKKDWLGCVSDWQLGVEADLLKSECETGQEAPSSVLVGPNSRLSPELFEVFGVHADKELRGSVKHYPSKAPY